MPSGRRAPPHPEDPVKTSRARLQSGILALLALALSFHGFLLYFFARDQVRGDADQFVLDKARLLARAVSGENLAHVAFNERDWRDDRLTPYAQTVDLEWQVHFLSSRLENPMVLSEEVQRYASHPLGLLVHDATDQQGTPYRVATFAIQRAESRRGYAQVGVRLSERDAPLRHLRSWLIGGSLATLALAAAGLHLILRQWQLPLLTFAQTARHLAADGASKHRFVAPPDSPELHELASTFNQLLDRQAHLQTSQQQFVADAAHELRTPLTVLRGELEIALRRPRSDLEYRETIETCREEIERLVRLTENLLALARLDSGAQLELRESLDLGTLCRDAAERFQPRARELHVPLAIHASQSLPILGDRLALERILYNLIDNALRYSPKNEPLEIRAFLDHSQTHSHAVAEITDQGPGIPADQLPRIFDRFYRVESSRPRDRGGAGLGLAIVQALVTAHQGSIQVRSQIGQGTTFSVRFPSA